MVLQEARSDLRDPRGFHARTHGTGSVSLVKNCSIVKLGKMAANINEVNIPPLHLPRADFKQTYEVPVTRETPFIDGNKKYACVLICDV